MAFLAKGAFLHMSIEPRVDVAEYRFGDGIAEEVRVGPRILVQFLVRQCHLLKKGLACFWGRIAVRAANQDQQWDWKVRGLGIDALHGVLLLSQPVRRDLGVAQWVFADELTNAASCDTDTAFASNCRFTLRVRCGQMRERTCMSRRRAAGASADRSKTGETQNTP